MTVQDLDPLDRELDRTLAHSAICGTTEAVYRQALRDGAIRVSPEVAQALGLPEPLLADRVARLTELRLLRAVPAAVGTSGTVPGGPEYRPVSPDVAAAALISPLEGEIHRRREEITSIRAELGPLNELYTRAAPGSPDAGQAGVRALAGPEAVAAALAAAIGAAEDEVVSIRPRGGLWEGGDDERLAQDLDVLARGVRLRVVYQHAARADLAVRAHARRIAAAGAQVRTTDQVPTELVVVDHRCALVAPAGSGALEIAGPGLAQVLLDVFGHAWATGQEYRATESGYEGVDDEIVRGIAQLLAQGLTDEVIARRMGMSVRACRRHVARLMKDLNAISRFQAGTRAARLGLISA